MPQPDLVALNGQAARDAFQNASFPKEGIVECEAFRYNYLNSLPVRRQSLSLPRTPIKVLILGDYTRSGTKEMLCLLEGAVRQMSAVATYTVKPHPNCIVTAAQYPSLHLTVVTEQLSKLLGDHDVALSGNLTSASVDAYVAGLSVVVILDEKTLNFSPLRGQMGVRFVNSSKDLASALESVARRPTVRPEAAEFFTLDPDMPRWRRTLDCG